MNAIEKAAGLFETKKEFASQLGVQPSFLSQWLSGHRRVPPAYCRKIEAVTDGAVTAEELRPDIFEPVSIAS